MQPYELQQLWIDLNILSYALCLFKSITTLSNKESFDPIYRSMHAMECDVEKHLQDPTHQISRQYGQRTGQVGKFYQVLAHLKSSGMQNLNKLLGLAQNK